MKRSAEHGFTLVELMVVIAIIAIASATVMFAMPDPRGRLVDDAETFAARVHAARDDAIVQSRDMRVIVTRAGYQFERRRQGKWQIVTEKPLAPVRWPDGTVAIGDASIVFDATGASDPATIELARDTQRIGIRIRPDGAVRVGS